MKKVGSMENIKWLKERVDKLHKLLEDPQPGLHMWVAAYGHLMSEINAFWKGEVKELEPPSSNILK